MKEDRLEGAPNLYVTKNIYINSALADSEASNTVMQSLLMADIEKAQLLH